jgi:hypothetical protein
MCAVNPQDQQEWILERVSQVKEYHSLHQAVSSAKVISQVQKRLGLTGDFSVLYTLLNFVSYFLGYPGRESDLKLFGSQGFSGL